MERNGKQLKGALLLALTAFIWGTAFVAQSVGMDYVGPCAFNAARSYIGFLAILPAALFFSRQGRGEKIQAGDGEPAVPFWKRHRALLLGGVLCGALLAAASMMQQIGIQTSSAGKAGFLTALYIVIVPVLGIFLGRRPGLLAWVSVAIALAGTWCLSMNGDFSIASGDIFLLLCALVFSLHILVIDHFSPQVNGVWLSCIQFFVAGVISTVVALFTETTNFADLLRAWGPLLYTGVLSSGVAYTLQIIGQKYVQPTVASLLMSLESVFAALAGWIVLREALSPREILGCVLVFSAVILAQMPVGSGSTHKQRPGGPERKTL